METISDIVETATYENEVHSGRDTATILTALTLIFGPIALGVAVAAATHPQETKVIWSVLTGH